MQQSKPLLGIAKTNMFDFYVGSRSRSSQFSEADFGSGPLKESGSMPRFGFNKNQSRSVKK
jgi:hypothetical protein